MVAIEEGRVMVEQMGGGEMVKEMMEGCGGEEVGVDILIIIEKHMVRDIITTYLRIKTLIAFVDGVITEKGSSHGFVAKFVFSVLTQTWKTIS